MFNKTRLFAVLLTLSLVCVAPVFAGDEPVLLTGSASSAIPVVFVYQNTDYEGEWTCGDESVTFVNGMVTGDAVTPGIYTNASGYSINLMYPTAEIDITLNGESIIGKTIHPADAPFVVVSVSTENGYYTEGGNNLGLVFSNDEQNIHNTSEFGGKYYDYRWNETRYSQYATSSHAKTGAWTVRAEFTTGYSNGALSASTPDAYRYSQNYSFTVSDTADAVNFPCIIIDGPSGVSLDPSYWSSDRKFYATYYDESGVRKSETILWTSSNPSVLTIDSMGDVTPKKTGEVEITASLAIDSTVSTSNTVSIEETRITKISGYGSSTLSIGTTGSVSVDLYDQFDIEVSPKDLQWEILEGNSNITLTDNLPTKSSVTITPVHPGSATILVYSASNVTLQWMHTVTVVNQSDSGNPTSIDVSDNSVLLYIGAEPTTDTVYAHVCDQYWSYLYDEEVEWNVDNTSVVSVTVNPDVNHPTLEALFTPKAAGTTTVLVSAKNNPLVNATIAVEVRESIITAVGFRYPNVMTVSSSDDNDIYSIDQYNRVVYDDTVNVTVNPTGLLQLSGNSQKSTSGIIIDSDDYVTITALQAGNVTLRAESVSNSSAYIEKQIQILPFDVARININGDSHIKVGDTDDYVNIGLYDSFGERISGSGFTVLWTVDNSSVLGVSVNESSTDSYIQFIGLSLGTATVRATLKENPSIYDEVTVRVIPASEGAYVEIKSNPKRISTLAEHAEIYAYLMDQYGSSIRNSPIVWTVGNASVLYLSSNETEHTDYIELIPVNPGTTTIRAAAKNDQTRYDEIEVTVEETVLTSVRLSGTTEMALLEDRRGYASAKVLDQFGCNVPSEKIIWTQSNSAVLRLSSSTSKSGSSIYLYPASVGTTVLRASSVTNSDLFWEMEVTVEEPVATEVNLRADYLTYDSINKVYVLVLGDTSEYVVGYVYDQFGHDLSSFNLSWSVDNQDILAFSSAESKPGEDVYLIPNKAGSAVITMAAVGNTSAIKTLPIVVEEPVVKSFYLSASQGYITLGNSYNMEAYSIRHQGGGWMKNETMVWSVDNPSVLSLSNETSITDNYGSSEITVTANALGTAEITVYPKSNPALKKSVVITVEESVITRISDKTYIGSGLTITSSQPRDVTLYLSDQRGFGVPNETLLWSVDNASILNLSQEKTITGIGGLSTVTITPKANGVTNVTIQSATNTSIVRTIPVTVNMPVLSKIVTSPSEVVISTASGDKSITIRVYDQRGYSISGQNLILSVDNPSVITLSEKSLITDDYNYIDITPNKAGTAVITITSADNPSISKQVNVTVEEPVLSKLQTGKSISVTIGHTTSAYVYAYDQFGYGIANEKISWDIEDSSIATLSSESTLTSKGGYSSINIIPKKEGTTVITIRSETNSSLVKEIPLTVESPKLSSISVSPSSIKLTIGNTESVWVYARDQFNYNIANEAIHLEVDNSSVISLSDTDVVTSSSGSKSLTVTPKSTGTAKITAYLKSNPALSKTITVVVEKPVVSRLSISSQVSLTTGTITPLYAYVYDQFGDSVNDVSIIWSVDNTSVVSLASSSSVTAVDGYSVMNLTAKAEGTAVITVYPSSNPSLKREIHVTVEDQVISRISASSSQSFVVDDSRSVAAYVDNQFGDGVEGEVVLWTVDNPSVLSLGAASSETNSYGTASVMTTAKAPGSATITATLASNSSMKVTIPVKVEKLVVSSITGDSAISVTPGTKADVWCYVFNQFGTFAKEVVHWKVEDTSILELSADSSVTSGNAYSPTYVSIIPKKLGVTTITVSSTNNPSVTHTITVTVEEAIVSTISSYDSLSSSEDKTAEILLLNQIGNEYIYGYVYNQFGTSLTGERVKWTVSNPAVLSLSTYESESAKTVYLTPKSEGTAVVTLSSVKNPAISKEITIRVVKPIITDIASSPNVDEYTFVLDSPSYLYGNIRYQDSTPASDELISWTVEDDSVLSLSTPLSLSSEAVMLTPVSVGSTTLTLTSVAYPELTKTIHISVKEAVPAKLTVSWPTYPATRAEGTIAIDAYTYLTAVVTTADGAVLPAEKVNITISNPDIVTVSPLNTESDLASLTGVYSVIPKAVGQTVLHISAVDNPAIAEDVTVTVVGNTEPVITLNEVADPLTMDSVERKSFSAKDQFGNPLKPELLSFKASDDSIVDIEVIDRYLGASIFSTYGSGSYPIHYTPKSIGSTELQAYLTSNPSVLSNSISLTVTSEDAAVSDLYFGIVQNAVKGESANGGGVYVHAPPVPSYLPAIQGSNTGIVVLSLNGTYEGTVLVVDQYGNNLPYEDVIISADTEGIVSVEKYTPVFGYAGYEHCYSFKITALKEGQTTLTAVSKSNSSVSQYLQVYVTNSSAFVSPLPPAEKPKEETTVIPPEFSPAAGTFTDSTTITLMTGTADAEIYYTTDGSTPTKNSNRYTAPFTISETTLIKAVAVKGSAVSVEVSALYTKYEPVKEYAVSVSGTNGGTVTADKTTAKDGDLIHLTITPNNNYQFVGWTITGTLSGKTVEKTAKVTEFAMWGEPVIVKAEFAETVDKTPKPVSVKITNVPSRIYEGDTGTLNAIIYDQFGERMEYNTVTWISDNSSILEIDSTSGAYTAHNGGSTFVTATSNSDANITAKMTMSVYVPPKPFISGEISGPDSAYYGVMSEPFVVTSEYTSHLHWDWGDGSKTQSMTKGFVDLLLQNIAADWAYRSVDVVAHTFIQLGDVEVTLTPANTYRFGEEKTFMVHVTYAPPRNLKITNGPSAVTAGETAVYTAFATGADKFIWYLDGVEVDGQTSHVASIPIPDTNAAKTSEVKVVAYKEGTACSPVTMTVDISVPGGELGSFGSLTVNPVKPTKGEVTVFTMEPVANAVSYTWEFADGTKLTTNAPSVSYTLQDKQTAKVTITAYNSVCLSKAQEFTFTAAGEKPEMPEVTADITTAYAGNTTVFTASADTATSWTWFIDGVVDSAATSNTYSRFWTVDEVGKHLITVTAENEYGSTTKNLGYTVLPKPGKPAVIENLLGPSLFIEGAEATFSAVIKSNDEYDVTWYLNGNLLSETSSVLKQTLNPGTYTLKVVVTTEYEEVSELEKSIVVKERDTASTAKKDTLKTAAENAQTLRLEDGSADGTSSLGSVGSVSIDAADISESAESVSVSVSPIDTEDLYGFTTEMGDAKDALLSVNITPTGLKNEKDLTSNAEIIFSLLKDDVADPDSVEFYRLDTGSGIDQWVKLHKLSCTEDGDFYVFCVAAAGMSQFVAVPVAVSGELEVPTIPTEEIKNTTASWNAATAAEVGYKLSAGNLGTISAPVISNGGVSLTLGEKVVVKKYVGGVATSVSATVLADGSVDVGSVDLSDAEYLEVSFVGRKLGDAVGTTLNTNGKVGVVSALKIAQKLAGIESVQMSDTDLFYANVNGDSKLSVLDALMIAQYLAGILDENYEKIV